MSAREFDGALLINKHPGITSFGVVQEIKTLLKRSGIRNPKVGHGGTLDPFATGLLVVVVGRAAKLAQYFLGSKKAYRGVIRFGETTQPGDPTSEIIERSAVLPEDIETLRRNGSLFLNQDYLQIPPMHSAKKVNGQPLYELARAGIEIDREPKRCRIFDFQVHSYNKPDAEFSLVCSSGTYVRVFAQDFGRVHNTVGMLTSLTRTASGRLNLERALSVKETEAQLQTVDSNWTELSNFVPFDRLLEGYPEAIATDFEARQLASGRQNILPALMNRARGMTDDDRLCPIYLEHRLIAVASKTADPTSLWKVDRVLMRQI